MRIEELRGEIDRIDSEIVSLLEQRVAAAKKIGQEKKKEGMDIEDAGREDAVLGKVKKTSLDKNFIEKLYKSIIAYCKDEER